MNVQAQKLPKDLYVENLSALFILCTNKTASHKVKPLCLRRFMKPHCFHHINMTSMPIDFKSSSNAWMTSIIFNEWFLETFVPQVTVHLCKICLLQKAVILLDNCHAHSPGDILQSHNIKGLYLQKQNVNASA